MGNHNCPRILEKGTLGDEIVEGAINTRFACFLAKLSQTLGMEPAEVFAASRKILEDAEIKQD